jgi:hypothetical protein
MSKKRAEPGERQRLLFVCFADSPHSQSWIDIVSDSEFDVRVFAAPAANGGKYMPQPWKYPTYVTVQPDRAVNGRQVIWMLPRLRRLSGLTDWAVNRYQFATRWLRRVILTWKPHIIHSLSMKPGASLTWNALQSIPPAVRPKWVVSSWGSDIHLRVDDPRGLENIKQILHNCSGFIADCRRDMRHALGAGLNPDKLALKEAIPVTGGLDVDTLPAAGEMGQSRNLILVPKAFEGPVNRTLTILEALRLTEDLLPEYEVHLLMCSREVQRWLRRMPESIRSRCHCHEMVPKEELMSMLGRTRVMIATSLSDGTPSVMLEAMATGALPLMSPLESIQEWIEHGVNGLLAEALYPERIASALRRALTDDMLCARAASVNRRIIGERANRAHIRHAVLNYYRSLADHSRRRILAGLP